MATKDRSRRAQCQAKKTGKNEEKIANATKCTEGGSKNSALNRNVWRPKAMVPRMIRTHCSIVRMARRREGLGVECFADLAILLVEVFGA